MAARDIYDVAERANVSIATVSRVYVEAEDTARLAGDDGDIPGLIAKPSLDHIVIGGGILEPVRHQLPNRVLGG